MLAAIVAQVVSCAGGAMTVNVYVSSGFRGCPQYGFLATNTPVSLLPRAESWKYVRSADAVELSLSDTDVKDLLRSGFKAREVGGSYSIR
jgi:hypothetical protein